jgi:hypothetical protein
LITEREVLDAIPKRRCFLREYAKYAAGCTDANLAYHVAGALTLLSQTVPITFFVPYGHPLYLNIYALAVGPSTLSRKSAAITVARRVLEAALPDRVANMPGSPEGLVDSLDSTPQQAIFYSEFGSLLSASERGYLMPLKTRLTEAYDCTPIGRQKANGKGVNAKTPRLSIFAGIAPGYLERHTEDVDWTEGFLARFLTFYAARQRYYEEPIFDEHGETRVAAWLKGYFEGWSTMQGTAGKCLGLADGGARTWWREWQKRIEDLSQHGPNRPTRPALARAPAMAMKIAGLLGWDFGDARNGNEWRLDEEMIVHATRVVDLHVESVLEIGAMLATDRDMRNRRKVLDAVTQWYKRHSSAIPLGQVLALAQITKRTARDLIDTLVEEGAIQFVNVEGSAAQHFVPASADPSLLVGASVVDPYAPSPLD